MADQIIFVNKGLSQQSFRIRPVVNGKPMKIRQSPLVIVPGRNPQSGVPGRSEPVDKSLLEALKDPAKKGRFVEWFQTLIEDDQGGLTIEQI